MAHCQLQYRNGVGIQIGVESVRWDELSSGSSLVHTFKSFMSCVLEVAGGNVLFVCCQLSNSLLRCVHFLMCIMAVTAFIGTGCD